MRGMNNLTAGYVIKPRLSFSNRFDKALYGLFVDEANFATTDYCERGQQRYVIKELAKDLRVTPNVISNSIKRLEQQGLIQKETLKQNKGILITINRYDDYQKLTTYQKPKEVQSKPEQVESCSKRTSAHEFYQQQIGILAPIIAEHITKWVSDFNGNHEVIIAAMKIAVERNIRNWRYIERILTDWYAQNVQSIEDVYALEKKRRREQRNASNQQTIQKYGRSTPRSSPKGKRTTSEFYKPTPIRNDIDLDIGDLL
jgi:DnaD/phage-associated family protein